RAGAHWSWTVSNSSELPPSVAREGQGNTLTPTDAQRGQALACIAALHLMQQGHQDPTARPANGVSQGDRATIDVDLVQIPAQLAGDGQRLGGESFVGFDQVQFLDLPAGLAQAALGRADRTDAHDRRVHAGDRKSTRLNSSHVKISYAVFCLKKE